MGLNPFDPSLINAAYRGIQPGAAPMLGSSNLTNAIPLTKFTYDFKNEFNPALTGTPQVTAGLPAGMSAADYAFYSDPKIPADVKSYRVLIPPKPTLDEKKAEWQAQADFMTQLDNQRGDRAQKYATQNLLTKSIIDSLGGIGRSLGSRYGSDPAAVAQAQLRMAELAANGLGPVSPPPNVQAVRYYNV